MERQIATFFGVGLLRPAPGTWGSAAAVALAVLACELGASLLVPVGVVLATLLGFWAVPRVTAASADKDPSEIVIDEVAGQWLAMCFTVIPLWRHGVSILDAWPGFVAPFLLFRLFDIWKPWLVGRADRRGDAAGVMLDDLWAGLFAGVVSVILAGLYHGLLEPML
ncbi:phosphatidylglycerophosphatase A [Paracoccus sp. CPCC 101403]|uniref:Phosphatidylglycerophosphatase A n=2 Tax=Paracoccus broussonetiae TaxID=3075834 RepID=A0ABU3EC34_9RHOB|nr:phosphatidylglycerophosphatase A [Paracoccus sp. CPCC 101403]MDT1061055.1 phosphatidylglycerophosphatase A [Paracoccus sp. CPCC 101403]